MYKQECPIQVIFSRGVEAVLRILCANHTVFVQKHQTELERICKHECSSKSVQVVANIHVNLQFFGKTALKRHITLSYKYRASEASEGKCAFFHQKILIVGLIVKFYKPFSQ